MKCRVCGGELGSKFDFGKICPSAFVNTEDITEKQPMNLAECKDCGLVQLYDSYNMDSMYRQYWYRSGLNASMVRDLKSVVENIESKIELSDNDIVVDIGANDGTLLGLYKNRNIFKIAFEPALNLKDYLVKKCDAYIPEYFDTTHYDKKNVKVVSSIAMFYDLPNPAKFVWDVATILREDGLWVIQFTDLKSMLDVNAFDNICMEHLEYYKLRDIMSLLDTVGMEVFDVSYNTTNGSSIRVFAGFKGKNKVSKRTAERIAEEDSFFNSGDKLSEFKDRVVIEKVVCMEFLHRKKREGKMICGLGASTKGNTLLQYYGIDNSIIDYIGEVNSDKFGLKTAGSDIPIVDEKGVFQLRPDYILVLPWHFKKFIQEKLTGYLDSGGSFIFPLPKMCVVSKKNGKLISEYLSE